MNAAAPAARRSAALAGLAVALLAGGAGWPPMPVAAASPFEVARQTNRNAPFSARVTVEWVDGQGRHSTSVEIGAANGLVRVAGAATPAGGPVVLGEGWLLVTRSGDAPAGTLPPAIERKYDIERLPGPVVAGRPTSLLVLRAGGAVRERLAVDETSGLVLRRELFGGADRPVRTVTVTELDDSPPELAAAPPAGTVAEPVDPEAQAAAYRSPKELAGGYERVAAFRREGAVHVLYSDGFHGLSLFVQPGRLDHDRLPPGGAAVRLGQAEALRYTWAGGEVVTWESGPVVRTLVGDAATEEVMAAARSVPPAPRPSLLSRLRTACRDIAEVLGAA